MGPFFGMMGPIIKACGIKEFKKVMGNFMFLEKMMVKFNLVSFKMENLWHIKVILNKNK